MPALKIRKRNGTIVDFDPTCITQAIIKATASTVEKESDIDIPPNFAETISDIVIANINEHFDGLETVPTVEAIQDIVEQELVKSGNFQIAKHYILYRAEHARLRAESRLEELKKIEKNLLKITKASGKTEIF